MTLNQSGKKRIDNKRRTSLKAIPLAGIAVVGSGSATATSPFPEIVSLPDGFQPEGFTTGHGHEFFVGSLASGAIYKGELRTGEGEILNPSIEDRVAVGLSFDQRSNHLFVAGGNTGKGYEYDAETGETAEIYTLGEDNFVNDLVVTSDAAFFTDSFRPFLYRYR